MMYGSYRWGEADNADAFMAGAVKVLIGYPEAIVRAVCDQAHGLPIKCQFPPQPYDISQECERRMKPLRDAENRRRRQEAEKADARPPLTEEEVARRREVVAAWRENRAMMIACAAATEGEPIHSMDPRECKGQMKELVQRALEDHLANLKAQSKDDPPQASTTLLVKLGVDPLGWGMGNRVNPRADELDDTLP